MLKLNDVKQRIKDEEPTKRIHTAGILLLGASSLIQQNYWSLVECMNNRNEFI